MREHWQGPEGMAKSTSDAKEQSRQAQGAGAIAKDKSPIEVQLSEQAERLGHLLNAVDELTDKLLSVLNGGDPRNVGGIDCSNKPSPPISCELEGILITSNREIREQADRLFQLRRLICL